MQERKNCEILVSCHLAYAMERLKPRPEWYLMHAKYLIKWKVFYFNTNICVLFLLTLAQEPLRPYQVLLFLFHLDHITSQCLPNFSFYAWCFTVCMVWYLAFEAACMFFLYSDLKNPPIFPLYILEVSYQTAYAILKLAWSFISDFHKIILDWSCGRFTQDFLSLKNMSSCAMSSQILRTVISQGCKE